MEEKKQFYRSRVEFILAKGLTEFQKSINDFCKDKFVVGIQYPDAFQDGEELVAVISYKVQEEKA